MRRALVPVLVLALTRLANSAADAADSQQTSCPVNAGLAGWTSSGPETTTSDEGVLVEADGTGGAWHFIAPRRIVAHRARLHQCCISFAIHHERVTAPAQRSSTCVKGKVAGDEYDVLLSGVDSAVQLGAVADAGTGVTSSFDDGLAPMAVRLDEMQGWRNVATGKLVEKAELLRVLGTLDALLLRPRPCLPPSLPDHGDVVAGGGSVVLRHFAILSACPQQLAVALGPSRGMGPGTREKKPVAYPATAEEEDTGTHKQTPGTSHAVRAPAWTGEEGAARLDACDAAFAAREWSTALDCYAAVLPV